MTDTPQELAPSPEMLKLLETRNWSFDLLRDPNWTPTREDYAALRDAAVAQAGEFDRYREALNAEITRLRKERDECKVDRDWPGIAALGHRIDGVNWARERLLAGAVSSGEPHA